MTQLMMIQHLNYEVITVDFEYIEYEVIQRP